MSEPAAAPDGRTDYYANAHRRTYALFVFMLVYMCHALDRRMPSILVEPVQQEFHLTDTQMGLFGGAGYGIAFSLAVLPLGYLVDRVNRRNLLALMTAIWSGATALGGMVGTYFQLILTRFGVGAAEAGGVPISMSFLSDVYTQERRALVIGFLYTAANVGQFAAMIAGAWVAAEHGWRAAMVVAGLPGLVCVLLLLFTVREPQRGAAEPSGEAAAAPPKPREVLRFILGAPELLSIIVAHALFGLVSISVTAWVASFFIRIYHVDLAAAGGLIGISAAIGGGLAPLLYGWLDNRLGRRNPAWPLRLVWLSAVIALVASEAMLFTPSLALAVFLFGFTELLRNGYPAITYATMTRNTPAHMRGSVISVMQLITNLSGYGRGPLFVGVVSDYYGGGTAIREALAVSLLLYIPATLCTLYTSHKLYGRAAKTT